MEYFRTSLNIDSKSDESPVTIADQRFPNKPMAKINGTPMIERVWRQGINSKVGDVYVACSEDEVFVLQDHQGQSE